MTIGLDLEGRPALVIDVTDEKALTVAIAQITENLGVGPVRHLVNVVGGNLSDEWFRSGRLTTVP